MANETCPTVQIHTEAGVVTINQSDFNEKEHKLAYEEVVDAPAEVAAELPAKTPTPWDVQ